jgi:hypothetical protein
MFKRSSTQTLIEVIFQITNRHPTSDRRLQLKAFFHREIALCEQPSARL